MPSCRLGELQLDLRHPRLGAVAVLPRVTSPVTPRAAVVGVRRVVARPRGAQRRRVGLGRARLGFRVRFRLWVWVRVWIRV